MKPTQDGCRHHRSRGVLLVGGRLRLHKGLEKARGVFYLLVGYLGRPLLRLLLAAAGGLADDVPLYFQAGVEGVPVALHGLLHQIEFRLNVPLVAPFQQARLVVDFLLQDVVPVQDVPEEPLLDEDLALAVALIQVNGPDHGLQSVRQNGFPPLTF